MQLSMQCMLLVGQLAVVGVVHAHGALAIDGNKGAHYGWAVNYPSARAAREHALRQCGRKCNVVMSFSKGCGAYAASQARGRDHHGWAHTRDESSARHRAMRECHNRGGRQCIVRVWGCTRH